MKKFILITVLIVTGLLFSGCLPVAKPKPITTGKYYDQQYGHSITLYDTNTFTLIQTMSGSSGGTATMRFIGDYKQNGSNELILTYVSTHNKQTMDETWKYDEANHTLTDTHRIVYVLQNDD